MIDIKNYLDFLDANFEDHIEINQQLEDKVMASKDVPIKIRIITEGDNIALFELNFYSNGYYQYSFVKKQGMYDFD